MNTFDFRKGNRMKKLITLLSLVAIFVVLSAGVSGCRKKTSQPPAATKSLIKAAPAVEQTTCPVMGGAINKDIFTEYKGKKVYFCCTDCKAEFEKNPEKYISKLPQFAK
jgi:YHS domain-containing protein